MKARSPRHHDDHAAARAGQCGRRVLNAVRITAVGTLFAPFASRETPVFEQDENFERRLTEAVCSMSPGEPLFPAVRREIHAIVWHCTFEEAALIWRMIDRMAVLRGYPPWWTRPSA